MDVVAQQQVHLIVAFVRLGFFLPYTACLYRLFCLNVVRVYASVAAQIPFLALLILCGVLCCCCGGSVGAHAALW